MATDNIDEHFFGESTIVYEVDILESQNEPNMSGMPELVIYPLVIAVSVIFLLLLATSILSKRIFRAPYFYVLLSWVLVNLLHVTTILPVSWIAYKQSSWTLGESGCKASIYFQWAFMFVKAYHMPLAVIMICLSSQLEHAFKARPWVRALIPVSACSGVWISVLLACIPYVGQTELVSYEMLPDQRRYFCIQDENQAIIVEMTFQFVIPIILSMVFVLLLGCLLVRRPSFFQTPNRQKVEVMSIFVILPVFILTNIARYIVFVRYYADETYQYHEHLELLVRVSHLVSLADFILAPCLCLLLPLFRDVFCLPRVLIARRGNNGDGDEHAEDQTAI